MPKPHFESAEHFKRPARSHYTPRQVKKAVGFCALRVWAQEVELAIRLPNDSEFRLKHGLGTIGRDLFNHLATALNSKVNWGLIW
jgi:hypothetical protein